MIAEAAAFEGKYEILEKIREGGMGAVYKVRHRLLGEIRVIKVIRPHLRASPEVGERFLREARLAIRVRHPNIAQLHDFSVDPDGTAYIVMEFIDGLTLSDVLARTAPLPVGLTLEITRGALGAVGHLHRRDLVHRDISPDNLMLGRDEEDEGPRVTLLDLGIAKSLAGSSVLTSTGAFLGKPRYASPEHFSVEGISAVGPRSDLYSLGVVLYELLTGVCPVQGRDTSSWIAGHLFRPPLAFAESDPEGRIPEDLRAAVLKVLAKAPADRFASAEEMAAALAPIRARFPVEPGSLERALGGLPEEAPSAAASSHGTTQDALDRRFAPLETPPPRPEPVATLVLRSRDELATPEPPQAPPSMEHTQVLPRSTAPEPLPEHPPPRPARRLVPAVLAALLLAALSLGIWWMMRPPEPAPPPPGPVAEAPVPARPEPLPPPKPVVVAPPPPATPAPESTPAVETPAPAPHERPKTEAPKRETRRLEKPAAPAPITEAPSEPAPAAAEPTSEPAAPPAPSPIQPARILSAPRPEYPRIARGSGIHAVIILLVRVDTKGLVESVEVRRALAKRGSNGKRPTSAQAEAFQEAAIEAVRKTLFQPATQNGKPMPWVMELVEDFLPE